MNNALIWMTLTTIATVAGGDLNPIPFTRGDHGISAITANGEVILAGREMLLDVTYPSGRAAKGDILVLFDKATGLFLWQYHALNPRESQTPQLAARLTDTSRVYVGNDRLVVFTCRATPLYVLESSERADSLDDAEAKSLQAAREQLKEIEGNGHGRAKPYEVSLPLPRDFFAPPFSAAPGKATITEVSRKDGKWELLLVGQWKAKVILDDKYQPISWERVP
jgi:hypothetical protein